MNGTDSIWNCVIITSTDIENGLSLGEDFHFTQTPNQHIEMKISYSEFFEQKFGGYCEFEHFEHVGLIEDFRP